MKQFFHVTLDVEVTTDIGNKTEAAIKRSVVSALRALRSPKASLDGVITVVRADVFDDTKRKSGS